VLNFLNLSKNLNELGTMKLKSRAAKTCYSMAKISSFLNLFSLMVMRSLSSGGYISSYLVAIRRAVTPSKWSSLFLMTY